MSKEINIIIQLHNQKLSEKVQNYVFTKGFKWGTGEPTTVKNHIVEDYGDNTCLHVETNVPLAYARKGFYEETFCELPIYSAETQWGEIQLLF